MKTRNGFVSNSSSSSFVLVTSKESFETALKQLPEGADKLLKNLSHGEKTISGVDLVAFGDCFDHSGNGTWDSATEGLDSNKDWYEIWEEFKKLVKNESMEVDQDW